MTSSESSQMRPHEDGSDVEKTPEHLEVIRTISKVPGNPNYHEKDGLRTAGDGVDHTKFHYRSIGFIMTVVGCAFALCGSQIYLLLYLTLGTTIAADLGRPDLYVWLLTAGVLAMGSIAPFIGPLSDMLGRKAILLCGFLCSTVGAIVCASTPNAAGFIAGQVLLGFGAVIQELLAIAVVAEIVPTARRPLFAVIVLSAIIPWSPGTLYANWIADKSWRWIGLCLAIWNVLNSVIILVFYRPPPRVNARGLSRREQLARIDFTGGALVTISLVLFLIGLNWGGQQYPWKSGHVLGFICAGVFVMIIFALWEFFGAKYPLYPRRIVHVPRPFFCMLFVIFAAGINYIPLVVFWPVETIAVYQANLFRVGVYTLPIGICVLAGAMISAGFLAVFKRHIHLVMLGFCIMQTIALACLVLADPFNINTAWAPLILALIGVGGVLVPNQVVITVITPDDLIASVTALTVGLRAQAQVIGLSLFYNRFQTKVTENTIKIGVKAFIGAGIFYGPLIKEMVTGLTSKPFAYWVTQVVELRRYPKDAEILKETMIHVYADSFQHVWYITIAFGVAACIAAACMGSVSKYLDKHVAVVLDK